MLTIAIKGGRCLNRLTSEIISCKPTTISLEHSLVSISKWEAKWHKPFLSKDPKTDEQILDYVKCMTITQNVDPNVYMFLGRDNLAAINAYIENPMTATWFNDKNNKGKRSSEQITSELIYYWMIASEIPFECQRWHLNRLMTLIRICSIKNQPAKKYSKRDIMSKNAALNAARRNKLGTSG